MKLVISYLLPIIACIGCTDVKNKNALIGNWKSDKDKTIEYSEKFFGGIPESKKKAFDSILGILEINFTHDKIITNYDGTKEEIDYSVVYETPHHITILVSESLSENEIIWFLDEEGYIYQKPDTPYMPREYFKKVNN